MKNLLSISKWSLILALLVAVIICSCKKKQEDNQPVNNSSVVLDAFTDQEAAALDSLQIDTITKFSDLVFHDGTSVDSFSMKYDSLFRQKYPTGRMQGGVLETDPKKRFIEEMEKYGFWLIIRSNHPYPDQNGIAYSFGSRQFDMLAPSSAPISPPAPKGDPGCKSEKYGLDCAGMIYQMAINSSISFQESAGNCGSTYLGTASNWNTAFQNSNDYQTLTMVNLESNYNITLIQFGDIIVWPNDHIGFVYREANSPNGLGVMNSNGYSESNSFVMLPNYPIPTNKCDANLDKRHGPIKYNLTQKYLTGTFGKNYQILRVNETGDSTINIVSGNNQTGEFGQPLSNPLKVQVIDNNNKPQSNILINFSVTNGGGSLTTTNVLTDANGNAQTTWTLGASGNQSVSVSAKNAGGKNIINSPVVFTASVPPDDLYAYWYESYIVPTNSNFVMGAVGPSAWTSIDTNYYANSGLGEIFFVYGPAANGGDLPFLNIQLPISAAGSIGTYQIDSINNFQADYYNSSVNCPYGTNPKDTGSITIIESTPTHLAGTFHFTAYCYGTSKCGFTAETVYITGGKFRCLKKAH